MRNALILSTAASCALLFAAPSGGSPGYATLVVDDDVQECATADFTRITAAVEAASAGDVIRVCPGLYSETVRVDKPLVIRGQPDAVEAVDCFATVPPTLSPQEHAIVRPGGDTAVAFTLAANDVDLSGFVVEGGAIGVVTDDRAVDGTPLSGYRVHHNLIRLQQRFDEFGGYAIDFAAGGPNESRVSHNCFREMTRPGGPGWGLATDFGDLFSARIDHNGSYGLDTAIEVSGTHMHSAVTIDHNSSMADRFSIRLWTSTGASRILGNTSVASKTVAIVVGGANPGLEIAENVISDGWQGLGFANAAFQRSLTDPTRFEPVEDVVVRENRITGMAREGIFAAPLADATGVQIGNLRSSLLENNVVLANGFPTRPGFGPVDGIVLRAGNRGNTLRANVVNGNARNGIYAQGAIANTFEANVMVGNRSADARDDSPSANTWLANTCGSSVPDWICKPA
jgi:parallel beta-helix repeat protein